MRTRQKARLEASRRKSIPEEVEEYIGLDVNSTAPVPSGVGGVTAPLDDVTAPDTLARALFAPDLVLPTRSSAGNLVSLSSSLDTGPAPELYFSCDADRMVHRLLAPRLPLGAGLAGNKSPQQEVMKNCVLTPDFEKRDCAPPLSVSKHQRKKLAKVCT